MHDLILNAGHDFESRVDALEQAYLDLDHGWAHKVAAELDVLAAELIRPGTLPRALRLLAQGVAGEVRVRGAEALCTPQAEWLESADSATHLATLQRLGLVELHAAFQQALLLEPQDYRLEVALAALVEVAAGRVDSRPEGDTLQELLGVRREVAFSPRAQAGRVAVYTVREGDDLRSIAQALYGSPEAWTQVRDDYGLYPPYVSSEYQNGTLSPGMRLRASNNNLPEAGSAFLGATLALDVENHGGYQQWDLVPGDDGGLAADFGLSALATDCALRIATPLGDLAEHPRYGLPEVQGMANSAETVALLMLATETLLEDDRVAKVIPSVKARGALNIGLGIAVIPAQEES